MTIGDNLIVLPLKNFVKIMVFLMTSFSPRTPQQNGVVERKNHTLQEFSRSMLNQYDLPKYFLAGAVNTACYILNRVLIRPSLDKTSYEVWRNKILNVGYFKVFGCKCFILNNEENFGKID